MNKKRALITGVTGQDGTYLAELLSNKNYEIFGTVRRTSRDICDPIENLRLQEKITLIPGDIRDEVTLLRALEIAKPDEIYNFASQSHVGISFECPEETRATNYDAAIFLIETALKQNPAVRIYQASSSEIFGNATTSPQTEQTKLNPASPYGEAKADALQKCREIRNLTNSFICSGITYNHESPRRPKNFVTRKITHSIAKIKAGMQESFTMGNIHTRRDWGYAGDYVEAMWKMMQAEKPSDFIIATGVTHSVQDFINASASALDIKLEWVGSSTEEKAINQKDGSMLVSIDKKFYRPAEPVNLVGDPSKIFEELGWKPQTDFSELVKMMTLHDYKTITMNDSVV